MHFGLYLWHAPVYGDQDSTKSQHISSIIKRLKTYQFLSLSCAFMWMSESWYWDVTGFELSPQGWVRSQADLAAKQEAEEAAAVAATPQTSISQISSRFARTCRRQWQTQGDRRHAQPHANTEAKPPKSQLPNVGAPLLANWLRPPRDSQQSSRQKRPHSRPSFWQHWVSAH